MSYVPVWKRPSAIEKGFFSLLQERGIPVRDDIPFYYTNRRGTTGSFKPDMCIEGLKLVIEIDGYRHNRPDRKARDDLRDSTIRSAGWGVIRIPTKRLNDQNGLYEEVEEIVQLWEAHQHSRSSKQPEMPAKEGTYVDIPVPPNYPPTPQYYPEESSNFSVALFVLLVGGLFILLSLYGPSMLENWRQDRAWEATFTQKFDAYRIDMTAQEYMQVSLPDPLDVKPETELLTHINANNSNYRIEIDWNKPPDNCVENACYPSDARILGVRLYRNNTLLKEKQEAILVEKESDPDYLNEKRDEKYPEGDYRTLFNILQVNMSQREFDQIFGEGGPFLPRDNNVVRRKFGPILGQVMRFKSEDSNYSVRFHWDQDPYDCGVQVPSCNGGPNDDELCSNLGCRPNSNAKVTGVLLLEGEVGLIEKGNEYYWGRRFAGIFSMLKHGMTPPEMGAYTGNISKTIREKTLSFNSAGLQYRIEVDWDPPLLTCVIESCGARYCQKRCNFNLAARLDRARLYVNDTLREETTSSGTRLLPIN